MTRGWGCPDCHKKRDGEVLALVMNVANSIHGWIQFTGVSAGDSETGEIPMLDFQLRVEHLSEGEVVRFRYYEKPCTSDRVLAMDSAMSLKLKVQSLSNEIIRRLRNTDRLTTQAEKAATLKILMLKLCRSGYPTQQGSRSSGLESEATWT